jgi:hypothetical protein
MQSPATSNTFLRSASNSQELAKLSEDVPVILRDTSHSTSITATLTPTTSTPRLHTTCVNEGVPLIGTYCKTQLS